MYLTFLEEQTIQNLVKKIWIYFNLSYQMHI